MTTRSTAATGAPCWADLFSADVAAAREFYPALFGWQAGEPSPEYGGYFMFTRDGVPVAGAMGDMGELAADNRWKPYLATTDLAKTLEVAQSEGADVRSPLMPVADLGVQAILTDPTSAPVGLWQAASFPGFTVLDEPGAPSWFELRTSGYDAALAFYTSVFGLHTRVVSDTEQMRYSTLRDPGVGEEDLAGVMGVATGDETQWLIYWAVADMDTALQALTRHGGSILVDAMDSPYGVLAHVADPTGAPFMLHYRAR